VSSKFPAANSPACISPWIFAAAEPAHWQGADPYERANPRLGNACCRDRRWRYGIDCIGTAIRQGALSVTQLEIMPRPPDKENKPLTWPNWPLKMRTSSSQEEGAERDFSILTKEFRGENGAVKKLVCVRVDANFKEIPDSAFELRADLVLLAMGFVSPVHEGLLVDLGVAFDPRGNVLADEVSYKTSLAKVFACGDMRRGQSLVVWAIREGPPNGAVRRYILDGIESVAEVNIIACRNTSQLQPQ